MLLGVGAARMRASDAACVTPTAQHVAFPAKRATRLRVALHSAAKISVQLADLRLFLRRESLGRAAACATSGAPSRQRPVKV